MKPIIILTIGICIWSCKSNVTENKNGSSKSINPKIKSANISSDWISSIDTIGGKTLFSYKYPRTLQKDFIQNGICFGKAKSQEEEFPNDMKLCVWFNDENLENYDTIINYEGRVWDFTPVILKENITVSNKSALGIKYLDQNRKICKQIILLTYNGAIFQIIANDVDSNTFENFVKSIQITDQKNVR